MLSSNQPVVGVGRSVRREVGTHGLGSGVAVLLAHCIFRNISVALHAAPFPLPIPSLSRCLPATSLQVRHAITSLERKKKESEEGLSEGGGKEREGRRSKELRTRSLARPFQSCRRDKGCFNVAPDAVTLLSHKKRISCWQEITPMKSSSPSL